MKASMIQITTGPSIADPADFIKYVVHHKVGEKHEYKCFCALGWRRWWPAFLVWAIRRHVRGIR